MTVFLMPGSPKSILRRAVGIAVVFAISAKVIVAEMVTLDGKTRANEGLQPVKGMSILPSSAAH